MINIPNPCLKFLAAITIIFLPMIFVSCSSEGDNKHAADDITWKTDSLALQKVKEDSAKETDTGANKVNFSKADSIKAADSVKKTKNPIRDFN